MRIDIVILIFFFACVSFLHRWLDIMQKNIDIRHFDFMSSAPNVGLTSCSSSQNKSAKICAFHLYEGVSVIIGMMSIPPLQVLYRNWSPTYITHILVQILLTGSSSLHNWPFISDPSSMVKLTSMLHPSPLLQWGDRPTSPQHKHQTMQQYEQELGASRAGTH